ncbi:DUF58 domain-containing protein [Luteipulveratus flavus]|uniref:DUF58 domain-containing protein n=1 Tax=Luteipulveratus flavus TaxID=3031728 RepID=A0ABT6C984_9MICO|nr:DUF58 domain-containing protein [Luteipulveratus sp. YIM 133296]MDF8265360.1 DUF58 domain-containing protein [Luteipulveratus sp. YIM 133296]
MSDRPEVTAGDGAIARWRPTPWFLQAALVGGVCLVLAVVLRRPDLLVLAAPFVVITAWSLATRPTGVPRIRTGVRTSWLREAESSAWDIEVADAEGAEQVITVLEEVPYVRTDPELGVSIGLLAGGRMRGSITWAPQRWGRRTVGNGTVTLISPWSAFRFGPVARSGTITHTAPQEEHFSLVAAAPHPLGLVGLNRSRRPGEGAEFADIRPFQRGDRLRRVHWPVSARTGQIHVRTSYADQDTEVLLLVDAHLDVGVSGGHQGQQSSLDLGVRSAAALAAHLLARGERVGLQVIGMHQPLRVPPAMGARQQRRIIDSLAEVHPSTGIAGSRRTRTPVRPGAGALVLILSPLITQDAAEQAVRLTQRGVTAVVVDCLPPDVEIDPAREPERLTAWRIRRLERELEIARLQERGVPVVPWKGPGSLDLVLRQIARRPPRTAAR